jgi:hypothetical protein
MADAATQVNTGNLTDIFLIRSRVSLLWRQRGAWGQNHEQMASNLL